MNSRYTALLLTLGMVVDGTYAQLSFGGHPLGLSKNNAIPTAPIEVMPAVDREALLAEDDARAQQGVKGPFRFGFNHATDLGLDNSGIWHQMSNGDRVWRLSIQCPEAYSINFEFHEYLVPEGAEVFVYNELGDVLGSFNAESNPGQTVLGVTQLAGELITVEYVEPLAVRGQGRLRIGQVTHAYRDIMGLTKGLGDSGSCNNNVICAVGDDWRAQIRSVAMITVGGSGICTGTLINNCDEDGTPYFLTANHCLGGNNTWVFRFNWNSPTCIINNNGPTNQTVSGSTLKVNSSTTDVALLQLNTTPPAGYNVFYSGWDRSTAIPTSAVGIHHPSGDVKKISFDNNALTTSTYLGNANSGTNFWRVGNWEDGTTEGGSSGSALFNPQGLVIGQLYGGFASCQSITADYYGRFSQSYPQLQTWLGNCGNQLFGYPSATSVDEQVSDNKMGVYPNPTRDRVTVTLPQFARAGARLVVYDALGQQVSSLSLGVGTERIQLDLAGRPTGLYFLELTSEEGRQVERLILND
jgi:lysyl endopeptidase